MAMTWRDGVTTLSVVVAITLDRAYFHNWNWPLFSNMSWVIIGLSFLMIICLIFGYLLDDSPTWLWTWIASGFSVAAAFLTVFGLLTSSPDIVLLLMINIVVFWFASITFHTVMPSSSNKGRTFA